MSLLKKGYIVTWYIRTHIHLDNDRIACRFLFFNGKTSITIPLN